MTARLGFGLAGLGRPAYITTDRTTDIGEAARRSVPAMRARAHHLLDAAWDLGIRFIDVARSYGLGEDFLGSWLNAHPDRRHALTIESKWGYEYVGAWQMNAAVHERKDHSLEMLNRQWHETVNALGDAPDLYLIHSLTPDSPALDNPALLRRLDDLRSTGVRVGFSTSGPAQGEVIQKALLNAHHPFSVVQATWNLLEPSAADALQHAHSAGWTVIIKEALANGELSRSTQRPHLQNMARRRQLALDELALGAALGQTFADVVLSGATTTAQLRAGLNSAPITWTSPHDLAVPPGTYWRERSSRPWT